jgi:hypothetical protein
MGKANDPHKPQTKNATDKAERDKRVDTYTAPQRAHIAQVLKLLAAREPGVIQSHPTLDRLIVECAYVPDAAECAQPHYRVRVAQEGKYPEGELWHAWCDAFGSPLELRNLMPQELTRRVCNDPHDKRGVKLFAKRFYFVAEV